MHCRNNGSLSIQKIVEVALTSQMLPGTTLRCGSTNKKKFVCNVSLPEGEHKKFRTVLLNDCKKHIFTSLGLICLAECELTSLSCCFSHKILSSLSLGKFPSCTEVIEVMVLMKELNLIFNVDKDVHKLH